MHYSMRLTTIILFLAGMALVSPLVAQTAEGSQDLAALYQQIDEAIERYPQYVAHREQQIDKSRQAFLSETAPDKKFSSAASLFRLYQPYQVDSALRFAEVCISLADTLHRPDLKGSYLALKARLCSGIGMYVEALDLLRQVDKAALDRQGLTNYYDASMHVCGEIGSYSHLPAVRQDYFDRQDLYRDSVLMVAEKGSEACLHLEMDVLSARRMYQDALNVSDRWLKMVSDGTHENAFAAFYRSVVYDKLGNESQSRYWLAKSALDDIKCAVMDQASLLMLAEHLSNDGDDDRSIRYARFGKECNIRFCDRLRTYQNSLVVNVLEKNYQSARDGYVRLAVVAATVIVLLLLLLAIVYFRCRARQS